MTNVWKLYRTYKIQLKNSDLDISVGATAAEYKDLASELKILIHVGEHKNIVNLLGACTKGDRLLIIMEYAPHGNLLKFLRGKREIYEPTWVTTTNNPEVELTITNLVVYAYQVSRGMEFLASRKVCFSRVYYVYTATVCGFFFLKKKTRKSQSKRTSSFSSLVLRK